MEADELVDNLTLEEAIQIVENAFQIISQKYAAIFVKLIYFQDYTFFLKKFEGILSITVGQNLVSKGRYFLKANT